MYDIKHKQYIQSKHNHNNKHNTIKTCRTNTNQIDKHMDIQDQSHNAKLR